VVGDHWNRATAKSLVAQANSDGRLALALLAQVVAGVESTDKSAWPHPDTRFGRYLGFLESCGYEMADVERIVTDAAATEAQREANDDANADLAGELWATGATLARAVGRSPDGSHSEDSVAASPLSRQEAKELGRRYGQDAIYEVTAEAVLLLSCDTDRVGTIARRPEATAGDEPTSQ